MTGPKGRATAKGKPMRLTSPSVPILHESCSQLHTMSTSIPTRGRARGRGEARHNDTTACRAQHTVVCCYEREPVVVLQVPVVFRTKEHSAARSQVAGIKNPVEPAAAVSPFPVQSFACNNNKSYCCCPSYLSPVVSDVSGSG
jgi:hypothetical protein